MKIQANTPAEYIAAVEPQRRSHLEKLRALVRKAVPDARESIQWGMITWTHDGRPFAALASQKSYLSLYLMDLYSKPGLRERHAKALAGLKMGKSCINFHDVAELPLDAIAAILKAAPTLEVKTGTLARKTKTKTKAAKSTKKKRGS